MRLFLKIWSDNFRLYDIISKLLPKFLGLSFFPSDSRPVNLWVHALSDWTAVFFFTLLFESLPAKYEDVIYG